MAKVDDVINLLSRYNEIIKHMNHSDNILITKELALKASMLSNDGNWGNGTKYIEQINEGFINISLQAGTPQVILTVLDTNQAIQDYRNYVSKSWWQFNGDSNRSNGGKTLPIVEELS